MAKTNQHTIKYRDIDGKIATAKVGDASSCAACGMATRHVREYHPHAACLMFKATHNGDTVRDNLEAVIEFAASGVKG